MPCREEEPAIEEIRPVLIVDLEKAGATFAGFKMIFTQEGAGSCLHLASVDGRLASVLGISSLVSQ